VPIHVVHVEHWKVMLYQFCPKMAYFELWGDANLVNKIMRFCTRSNSRLLWATGQKNFSATINKTAEFEV